MNCVLLVKALHCLDELLSDSIFDGRGRQEKSELGDLTNQFNPLVFLDCITRVIWLELIDHGVFAIFLIDSVPLV